MPPPSNDVKPMALRFISFEIFVIKAVRREMEIWKSKEEYFDAQ